MHSKSPRRALILRKDNSGKIELNSKYALKSNFDELKQLKTPN